MDLREKISEIVADAYDGWANSDGYNLTAFTISAADRILALPQFEALKLVGIMKYEG